MSFKFNWPQWNEQFVREVEKKVETAMNSAPADPAVVEPFVVKRINFGTKPPIVKLEKIVELTEKYTEIIIYLAYSGDGSITVQTRVQLNKAIGSAQNSYLNYSSIGKSIMSEKPLEMPLELTIQDFVLEGRVRIFVKNMPIDQAIQGKPLTEGEPCVVGVQLMSNPFKSCLVSTNFETEIPIIKPVFQGMIENNIQKAVKGLLEKPLEINLFQS